MNLDSHKKDFGPDGLSDVQISEVRKVLLDQKETIRSKRSLTIKLTNFPQNASLSSIFYVARQLIHDLSINIERLLVAENNLNVVPEEILWVCDQRLKVLDLHGNDLCEVPESLFLLFPNLEFLDLSENRLWNLPKSMKFLESLRLLNLNDNVFSYMPPILGELYNLEKVSVDGNHLTLPSQQLIQSFEKDTSRLRAYLLSNSTLLDASLSQQMHKSRANSSRSRSSSDVRPKSSKATKRMGLIINKNNKSDNKSETSFRGDARTDLNDPSLSDLSQAHSHLKTSPPSTTKTRSRQSTISEINDMLQQPELNDSESGAYFRRLSTLQELPQATNTKDSTGRVDEISEHTKATDGHTGRIRANLAPNFTAKQTDTSSVPRFLGSHESQQTDEAILTESISVNLISILKVARKVLFSFSEFHSSIKRLTGFCTDRKIAAKTISLLHNSKADIDFLVETMEMVEERNENSVQLLAAVTTCVFSFKHILNFLVDNYSIFVSRIDVCFIRMVYLTIFGAFSELQNAYRLLNPSSVKRSHPQPPAVTADIRAKLQANQIPDFHVESMKDQQSLNQLLQSAEHTLSMEEIDEKLYESIELAIANAQVVFNELTKAINKSAVASTNNGPQVMSSVVATKFKDLTNTCMALMDITRRLSLNLASIKFNTTPQMKRNFWDDINTFLKAIIQTFSSVKLIMKDAPILNDVRQSMASLTRATKELTILLEASSYSSFSEQSQSSTLGWSNSHTNLTHLGPSAPPVRMPLVATVGAAAAQAIMPSSESSSSSYQPPLTGDSSTLKTPSEHQATSPIKTVHKWAESESLGLILPSRKD